MGSKTLIISVQELVRKVVPDLPNDYQIMGAFIDTVAPPEHPADMPIVVVITSDKFEHNDSAPAGENWLTVK